MAHAAQITDHLLDILETINAKNILDVGCGAGGLSRLLAQNGYQICGIDPSETHILKARELLREGEFITAGAEDIPKAEASFDAVVLVNSFHHVPAVAMHDALDECYRVLRPGGELIIIEPLARGSFFEAMRPLEDETEIRNHARTIIEGAAELPHWTEMSCLELDRTSSFENENAFIELVVGVDPSRTAAAKTHKDQISALFEKYAKKIEDKFMLVQPHIIWRLKAEPEGRK